VNFGVRDFELTPGELSQIDAMSTVSEG